MASGSSTPRTVAVAIMAKAPWPGTVKTRLCPPLLATEAAALYRCFLLDKIRAVGALTGAQPVIAYMPDAARAEFDTLAPSFTLVPQRGPDLTRALPSAGRRLPRSSRPRCRTRAHGRWWVLSDRRPSPSSRAVRRHALEHPGSARGDAASCRRRGLARGLSASVVRRRHARRSRALVEEHQHRRGNGGPGNGALPHHLAGVTGRLCRAGRRLREARARPDADQRDHPRRHRVALDRE